MPICSLFCLAIFGLLYEYLFLDMLLMAVLNFYITPECGNVPHRNPWFVRLCDARSFAKRVVSLFSYCGFSANVGLQVYLPRGS